MTRPSSDAGPSENVIVAAFLLGETDVFYQLEAADFQTPLGRTVFGIVAALVAAGQEVNMLTIDRQYAALPGYPGFMALQGCERSVPTTALRFTAINELKRARAMREAQAFRPADHEPEQLPHEFLEQARKIRGLLNFDSESICDIAAELKRSVPKTPTGFPKLDELLEGGIERGGVFTIGGIPGDGKTAIATHMTAKALEQGRSVHFVTLEMTRAPLVRRVMKAYWGKTQEEISADVDAALQMAGQLTVSTTLSRLPDVIASMGRHADADLIVIDYAQRVRDDDYKNNRVSEIEAVYGALANFAREFEVPLVVLSQLNRDYKSDKSEPPQMYHMKGSGAIEADSHIIGLLHNPNAKSEQDAGLVKGKDEERVLYIRKNRNGPIGAIRFIFDKRKSMFLEDSFYDS